MSTVKLQSLIRKFKSATKEKTEKNKIITNYQHDLTVELLLDTSYLFSSNNINTHKYTLISATIPDVIQIDTSINDYINIYLNNVYNTELCSETWLINTYMMHNIRHNFIINDNVSIKSLHIADVNEVSAFNHYILNGALPELINPEWSWLNISNANAADSETNACIKKKYANNMLQLLDTHIHTANNINYIVNEVNDKFYKINFLCNTYTNVNICDNHDNSLRNDKNIETTLHSNNHLHLTNAALTIKIMESQGICLIQIPNANDWNTSFINVLLLYCLLFSEVYIFTFDLLTRHTYLLCKTKKKINNEITYKKLMHIILNKDFTADTNLFCESLFTQPAIADWLHNVKQIQTDKKNNIVFSDILILVNSVCQINTQMFL